MDVEQKITMAENMAAAAARLAALALQVVDRRLAGEPVDAAQLAQLRTAMAENQRLLDDYQRRGE